MNVALSMASFLVALAAGVMLDGDRHARDAPSGTMDSLSAASPAGPSDAMASPEGPTYSSDVANVLLARANACANAGDWLCVIEATSNVISLHGDTPETQALLGYAVTNGGWAPSQAAPRTLVDHLSNPSLAQPAPPARPVQPAPSAQAARSSPTGASQQARHGHRMPVRSHSTHTRSNPGDELAELYRH